MPNPLGVVASLPAILNVGPHNERLAMLSDVPSESAINARLAGAYFHDCYTVSVRDTKATALGYFLSAVASTPRWVDVLMALRNKLVQLVGLKDLGGLGELSQLKPAAEYQQENE